MIPGTGYKCGIADPPWPYDTWSSKGKGRSQEQHYKTMSIGDICRYGHHVYPAMAEDSCMFMWATGFHLPAAFEVLKAWGFEFKSLAFVWVKTTKAGDPSTGLGKWTRTNAELVLLGTRGKPTRLAADVHQIVQAPRGPHSVKPEAVQDRIERLVDGPRLELFARRHRPGWTCCGDQLPAVEDGEEDVFG